MSAWVFGSIAIEITGSGNCIDSSTIGWRGSQSVSPVETDLKPTAAMMSPANASAISCALVGVHLEQATDALLAVAAHVQDLVARLRCVPE